MQAENYSIIFQIAILVISVVVHEVAHGYSALYFGDETAKREGRLTLNPIKHLDFFGSFFLPFLLSVAGAPVFGWAKPVPVREENLKGGNKALFWVAFWGPLSNIIIFSFFLAILSIFKVSILESNVSGLILQIILINFFLAFFNLMPIPPLDGSKILFSLLPKGEKYFKFKTFLENYSIIIFIVFIFTLWDFISKGAFGLFLYFIEYVIM